jgi:hypothetical protein
LAVSSSPVRIPRQEDAEGVLVRTIDDQAYNHPVSLAQYIMRMLSNYVLFGEQAYLEEVIEHAARLWSVVDVV